MHSNALQPKVCVPGVLLRPAHVYCSNLWWWCVGAWRVINSKHNTSPLQFVYSLRRPTVRMADFNPHELLLHFRPSVDYFCSISHDIIACTSKICAWTPHVVTNAAKLYSVSTPYHPQSARVRQYVYVRHGASLGSVALCGGSVQFPLAMCIILYHWC